ncbi:MAG: hypothetical protein QXK12_04355 [Candidatus Nezhaarchaeales archaeon]
MPLIKQRGLDSTCQECIGLQTTLKRLEGEVEMLRGYCEDGVGDYSLLVEKVRVYRLWLKVMVKHREAHRGL